MDALTRRYARLYNDGSLNISSEGEDVSRALHLLSGSRDDDDTQLVEIEMRIVRSLGAPKLQIIPDAPLRGLVFIEDDGTIRLPTTRDI